MDIIITLLQCIGIAIAILLMLLGSLLTLEIVFPNKDYILIADVLRYIAGIKKD